jgi:hypothetical protein
MRAFVALTLGAIVMLTSAGCTGSVGLPAPSSTPTRPAPTASAAPTLEVAATAVASDPSPTVDAIPSASPAPAGSPQTEWTLDLYHAAGVRRQYPDLFACTAAAVQTSLNLIARDANPLWSPSTSYRTQEKIFAYERAHMTMRASSEGSDPHGTRNALNYFGWGSMDAGVYVDVAEPSFEAASKAIVASIARTRKPAIIFTWYGGHSQVVTGYRAHGQNPATSDDFTVEGIYLTDPLLGHSWIVYGGVVRDVVGIRPDTWVTQAAWKSGSDPVRFTDYRQTDSPLRDPIDGRIGKVEWSRKWVVVLALS